MEIFTMKILTEMKTHSFFQNQEDETKKWIDFEFIISDDYNDSFMKHLVNIKVKMTSMICSPTKIQIFCSTISMIT